MKKKAFRGVLAIVFIFTMLLFVIFGIFKLQFFIDESPNGEYQIVSWWIDKGGWGYGGSFYVKEKGLFSKWHKLGTVPFSSEWLSETDFSIYCPYPFDEDIYKEYNANEFFNK